MNTQGKPYVCGWGMPVVQETHAIRAVTNDRLDDLVRHHLDYEAWLADGDKASDPRYDEERVDWLYETAELVGSLVRAHLALPGKERT